VIQTFIFLVGVAVGATGTLTLWMVSTDFAVVHWVRRRHAQRRLPRATARLISRRGAEPTRATELLDGERFVPAELEDYP